MKTKAYQIDLGRQVERPEFVMDWIPRHAEWGYNVLVLYLEDAYRFPSHPEFAQPRAWTPRQMEQVVKCADRSGMKVIPVVPALGHTAYFLKTPKYRHIGERRETTGGDGIPVMSGQVCPSLDETYAFLNDLFRDIAPFCSAGYLHVSLDESFDLGVCSLCRRRVGRAGHGRLFVEHLKRLHDSVRRLNLRMGVWADMFYYFPELIREVPKDVAMFDWYYYPFKRTPRVEMFTFRGVDSARALVQAGLETWASPNNGPFFCEIAPPFTDRLRNIASWWHYGRKVGCEALCVTSWSPTYAGADLNNLVNAAAADLWLEPKTTDYGEMLAHGLQRMYGKAGRAARPVLDLLDRHQLCGYWRYQLVRAPLAKTATLDAPGPFDAAVREFQAVGARAKTPPALQHTLAIREYYIHRERLSRAGSTLLVEARKAVARSQPVAVKAPVARIRAMLKSAEKHRRLALKATQSLWKSTRYGDQPNPLAKIVEQDADAFRRLARFLARGIRKPSALLGSCDLLGARQLLVTARCRRPCQQGLQVEISTDGKEFKAIHTLYLLEFTADAGEPLTNFVHRHSMAVPDDVAADRPLFVRFSARGLGEVDISAPLLLDGARSVRPAQLVDQAGRVRGAPNLLGRGWTTMGNRSPTHGFPTPDTFARDHHATVLWTPRAT